MKDNDSGFLFDKDFFFDIGVGLGILVFGMLAIAGVITVMTVL